jgi:hypothetical protein
MASFLADGLKLAGRPKKTEKKLNRSEVEGEVEVEVKLRPTVGRPVYLGVELPSRDHDQIFVFCLIVADFLLWGALSDERMGL